MWKVYYISYHNQQNYEIFLFEKGNIEKNLPYGRPYGSPFSG
jgi:hypothetical protein